MKDFASCNGSVAPMVDSSFTSVGGTESLRGVFLGYNRPYMEVREVQNRFVQKRLSGELEHDLLLFCEHLPTLSMGWRAEESDLYLEIDEYAKRGIEVVRSDRGGQTTYHGPGQLVIYPVVQLKQRHFGVRRFVELMLLAIVDYLKSLGVEAEASLNPSGIWVPPKDKPPLRAGTDSAAKIGSAGLRVVRGVTNHGFSLNVTINQEPYGLFTSCGVAETTFTCISNEFDDVAPSLEELSVELTRVLARRLEGANLSGLSA